jgi:hypothetical protein
MNLMSAAAGQNSPAASEDLARHSHPPTIHASRFLKTRRCGGDRRRGQLAQPMVRHAAEQPSISSVQSGDVSSIRGGVTRRPAVPGPHRLVDDGSFRTSSRGVCGRIAETDLTVNA